MTILSLRSSRRALGAAILSGESLSLFDGRHLSGVRERAEKTATAYVERLIATHTPRGCVIFAPDERHDSPSSILRVLQTTLVRAGVSVRVIRQHEILRAFGRPPLRNGRELHETVTTLLPELRAVRGAARPYIIEAAAVALYAESMLGIIAPAS